MEVKRCPANPIITTASVRPSCEGLKVVGAFNPAAVHQNGITTLLLRVAETYSLQTDDTVTVPLARTVLRSISTDASPQSVSLEEKVLQRADPTLDFVSDARVVLSANETTPTVRYLTSISHLRRARSNDGVSFQVDSSPFLFPGLEFVSDAELVNSHLVADIRGDLELEEWGVEDPRIVHFADMSPPLLEVLPVRLRRRLDLRHQAFMKAGYPDEPWTTLVTYTAVSAKGAATCMAVTTPSMDRIARLGVIFVPENKDVCIFPTIFTIDGKEPHFCCFHRPVPKSFGNPDIWFARSPDLVSWGQHKHVVAGTADASRWDGGRVGGGAPSVLCKGKGWLHIYHAADPRHRYCLGAFLSSELDPSLVLAKSRLPILSPDMEYEQKGFFPNVVFTCGVVLKEVEGSDGEELWVYYGAADDKVALAVFPMGVIYNSLEAV